MASGWQIHATSLTDPGRRRPDNEDWCGSLAPVDSTEALRSGVLYVIADGASGYGTGHEASQLAGSSVIESYAASTETGVGARLQQAVLAGNEAVRARRAALAGGAQARPFLATAI